MFQKLKQFKEMRDQGKQMKEMMDAIVVVGSGARNKIMVTLNGSHEVLGVQIEEGMGKSDMESGVKDAFTDANKKLQQELMKKMQEMGGIGGLADMMKGLGGGQE
jgi:DNA-binding protein YbaB